MLQVGKEFVAKSVSSYSCSQTQISGQTAQTTHAGAASASMSAVQYLLYSAMSGPSMGWLCGEHEVVKSVGKFWDTRRSYLWRRTGQLHSMPLILLTCKADRTFCQTRQQACRGALTRSSGVHSALFSKPWGFEG